MRRKLAASFAAGMLAGVGGVGLATGLVDTDTPAPVAEASYEPPYGSRELTDATGTRLAAELLRKAGGEMTCTHDVKGGPTATLCSRGANGVWIGDAAASAIGVPYGTAALSLGPDGRVYVR